MSIDTASINFPQVWEEFDLGSLIANVRESARITKDEKYELWSVPSFSDGKPEYVTGDEIGSGKLLVEKDDVLISKINPRINRVWMVTEPKSSGLIQVASPEWLVARVKDHKRVLVPFLAFYLSSPVFRDWISSASSSVTGSHSRAKTGQILEQIVPVPPLEEQVKIVEILEEQLSHLDVALASVRTARVKAARFRRSLLHAAFSGALTRHDFPDGELPEGWRKSTISEVADVVGGRTPTKFEQRLADTDSPNRRVPFYKVGDMNSSIRFLSESRVYFAESEASEFGIEILKSGTVIFPKAGGAIATNKKRILELPGAIDLNCMGVTANGVLHEKLLYWFFESFNLSSIADGTVLPQINKKKVSALEIAFPIGKDEQAKLLDEIETEISKSEAVVQVVDEVGEKSFALRRSLLHAAFSGELTKEWREGANV